MDKEKINNKKYVKKYMEQNNFTSILYLIRHGLTVHNEKQLVQGQIDGKLTETGINQAIKTGDFLSDLSFDNAFVSDLGRTKETYSGIINNKEICKTVDYIKLLREKYCGELEQKPQSYTDKLIEESNIPVRKYKFKDEENWEDVYKRAEEFIALLLKEEHKNKKILAVSHGGFIMEFLNVYNFLNNNIEPIYNEKIKNCAITIFGLNHNNKEIKLLLENYNDHIN